MTPTIHWFHIRTETRWPIFLAGIFHLVMGPGFAIVPPMMVPEFQTFWGILGCCLLGTVLAGLGGHCLWVLKTPEPYRLGLSQFGIHPADPNADPIPWSELKSIRERLYLSRLDLLGEEGRLLGTLEYWWAGFEEATAILCSHLPLPEDVASKSLFQGVQGQRTRLTLSRLLIETWHLGFTILAFVGAMPHFFVLFMWLCSRMAFSLLPRQERRDKLQYVWVWEEGLLVRREEQDREYLFADVQSVALSLRRPEGDEIPGQQLDVRLTLVNGDKVFIRPPGVDAVELYLRVDLGWQTIWR